MAVSLSVVGFAGVASAGTVTTNVSITGIPGTGNTLTAVGYGSTTLQWYDCTTAQTQGDLVSAPTGTPLTFGSTCTAIASATGSSYVVTASDASAPGPYITVVAYNGTVYTEATSVTATNETVSVTNLAFPGQSPAPASAGQHLTAVPTVTTNTPTYAWYDCTTPVSAGYVSGVPSNCTLSSTSTSSTTYDLLAGDYGSYVTVTAVESPATIAAVAASTALVSEPAPTVAASPSLDVNSGGSYLAGTSATPTTVANAFNPLYNTTATYQWYDCNAQVTSTSTTLPSGCTAIATSAADPSTASTYTFAVGDLTKFVLVQVTETNAAGSATIYSTSTTSSISGTAPTVSGTMPALSGQTATQITIGSIGQWTGAPMPSSYTVTWYRCTATGIAASNTLNGTCYAIAGSTTTLTVPLPNSLPSYTFTSADLNHTVLIGVTANNGIYSPYVAYSNSSSTFSGAAPSVAIAPTISGTTTVGDTLSANNGTWSGAPLPTSFSYQWYLCGSSYSGGGQVSSTLPSNYTNCAATGFTGSTYSIPTGVVGKYVLVQVTTNNGVGSFSYQTATVGPVTAATLSTTGSVSIGEGSNGTFTASVTPFTGGSPDPTSYAYTWYDCRLPVSASASPGALVSLTNCTQSPTTSNATTHAVTSTDVSYASGGGLMVVTSATTIAGTVYVNSATTAITNVAPTGGSVTVSGTGSLSSPFSASATWTAIPAPTISYQWYMCTTQGLVPPVNGCIAQSATSSTFSPTTYNASYPYAIVVATASNGVGTNTQYSNGSLLSPQPIVVTAYPTIMVTPVTATVTTASTLSVANGVWQGVPAPTFSYQWYVCTTSVASPSSTVPSGCSAIPGASSATYNPSGSYVGQYFVAEVTGTNGYPGSGSVSVFTASTASGLISTLSITSLTISGTPTVGSSLVATAVVNAQAAYTTAYQWYQCTLAVNAAATVPYYCTTIPNATAATFVPTTAQTSYYVTVLETVTSGASSATAVAASATPITTNIPGAPGTPYASAGVGQATVSWSAPSTGAPATSYTVTASTGGASCTSITTTCVVTGLYFGTYYTFTVKATNAYGTGLASVASNSITPSEAVPSAPTTVTAVAGVLSATVSWTAANANGSAISSYTVTSSPGAFSCSSSATSCVVSGLSANTAYTFTVRATNGVGVGSSSFASPSVTPNPNTPNAPTGVTARRGSGKLIVSWTAGAVNGATVTGYVATATGGGTSKYCTSTTATSCTIAGLTNGVPYVVTVIAQSSGGSSPVASGPRIAPAGAPSAPVIYRSVARPGAIIVFFHASAQTNGAPVAYYQYLVGGRWTVQPIKGRLFIVVRGLARHHAYIVRVRAVNMGGASPASGWVRVITL